MSTDIDVIHNWFNVEIPQAVNNRQEYLKCFKGRYKFEIKDHGGWLLNMSSTPQSVIETEEWGESSMEISAEHFRQILENPLHVFDLYNSKSIRLKGNTIIWARLFQIIQVTRNLI